MRLIVFKKILVILALFGCGLLAGAATAQSTTVSVTVTDPSSQVWANGTISYVFQGNGYFNGVYQWNGSAIPSNYLVPTVVNLNGSGAASFTIPTSTVITPALSTWKYVVCPNASFQCTVLTIPTAGSTQNISSLVNAALINISLSATPLPRAYSDSEITVQPSTGGIYYNTITALPKYFDGSSWHNIIGCSSNCIVTNPASSTTPQSVASPFCSLIVCINYDPVGNTYEPGDIITSGTLGIYGDGGGYIGTYSNDYACSWTTSNNWNCHRYGSWPSLSDTTSDQADYYNTGPGSPTFGTIQSKVLNNGTFQVKIASYTVSGLPSASYVGQGTTVLVTDATTFTVGTCTGGGSDTMLAVSNGTSWSCH